MPARIEAIRNGVTETLIPIERVTSRVGGAAPSDLVFSGLPPHVLTLEFVDGQYTVLNTGDDTLFLEEDVLPVGTQIVWEKQETLQIANGLTLRLLVDNDPTPKPVGRTLLGIRPKSLLNEVDRQERDRTTRLLMMLTAIMLGIAFLSYQIVFSKPDPHRHTKVQFKEILQRLGEESARLSADRSKQSDQRNLEDLANAFKRGRIAELDGDSNEARGIFSAIQRQVKDQYLSNDGRTFTDSFFARISRFAYARQQANGLDIDASLE